MNTIYILAVIGLVTVASAAGLGVWVAVGAFIEWRARRRRLANINHWVGRR